MPMIEYCLKELPKCNLVGVIGYQITSRKKGVKWGVWFEKMFGENLYKYAERMAKEKGS